MIPSEIGPRRIQGIRFAVLLGLMCVGMPANTSFAQEAHDPEHAVAHAGAEHAHDDAHGEQGHHGPKIHGKSPANNLGEGTGFLDVSPELFVWTILVFVVTSLVLRKLAWEPYLKALDEREQRIAEGLNLAETARKHAEELLAVQEREMKRAFEEARIILDEVRSQATRETEAILSKARTEAEAEQHKAMQEIEAAREESLRELRIAAIDLGTQVASKVVNKKLDPAAYRHLVEEGMA